MHTTCRLQVKHSWLYNTDYKQVHGGDKMVLKEQDELNWPRNKQVHLETVWKSESSLAAEATAVLLSTKSPEPIL